MGDDKTKKVIGRWMPGGQRYAKQDGTALKTLRPAHGWRNGARVKRVK